MAYDQRRQHILHAASAVIIRQGYDQVSMRHIAGEAGVSRGTIYRYFKDKEQLFDSIFYEEFLQYAQTWIERIEADPDGGTVGGIYRAVLHAIKRHPFMAAMIRRDQHIFGSYLRKPNNIFTSMQPSSFSSGLLSALQEAGTVRIDVDPVVMAHIMDMLSYGMITIEEFKDPNELPSYDIVMETIADIMDQILTPEDGGNSEAGKEVIRQLAAGLKVQPPTERKRG